MAIRISGVILPPNKHLRIALRAVYGIGSYRAGLICEKADLDPAQKVSTLRDDQASLIQAAVNEYEVEGDLRRRVAMNIKRLVDVKCYRGLRHKKGRKRQSQMPKAAADSKK